MYAAREFDKIIPMNIITIKSFKIFFIFLSKSPNKSTTAIGKEMANNPAAAFTLGISPPERKYILISKSKKLKLLSASS